MPFYGIEQSILLIYKVGLFFFLLSGYSLCTLEQLHLTGGTLAVDTASVSSTRV